METVNMAKTNQRPAMAEIFDSLQESGKRMADIRARLYNALNRFYPDMNLSEKEQERKPKQDGAIGDMKVFSEDLRKLASVMESDINKLEQII